MTTMNATEKKPPNAVVWCSAHVARQLHPHPPTADSQCAALSFRSSRLLQVEICGRRVSAGLICISWSCSCGAIPSHSRWIDASLISFAVRASNADARAILGRSTHEPPFEDENDRQLTLWTSPRLGRFVAAAVPVRPGACVMRATAFAVVVSDRAAATRCHWCFSQLRKKAFRCGACEFAMYCSRDCLQADATLHDVQCPTLLQLKVFPTHGQIDQEMLRLTVAVLMMELFVQNTEALTSILIPISGDSTSNLALDKATVLLCKILKKSATPLASVTRAHIRMTIQKLQANAHPLHLSGSSGVCGLGIFPDAAMTLNHSCAPNVVPSFDPTTRTLRFHAIQSIQKMELIEYSYLADLTISTARRQEMLLDGFGFVCECRRCVCDTDTPQDLNQQEAELTKELVQCSSERDPLVVLGRLSKLAALHDELLCRRPELAFSIQMLELRAAIQANDWRRAIAVAQNLLTIWDAQGLPAHYTTTETLHQQIALAAMRLGDEATAARATQRVHEIQRICGWQGQ